MAIDCPSALPRVAASDLAGDGAHHRIGWRKRQRPRASLSRTFTFQKALRLWRSLFLRRMCEASTNRRSHGSQRWSRHIGLRHRVKRHTGGYGSTQEGMDQIKKLVDEAAAKQ